MSITDVVIPFPIRASSQSWPSERDAERQIRPRELARRIRDLIAAGQLRPGTTLTLRNLCARFGVSRASIGEAVRLLVTDGRSRPFASEGVAVDPVMQAKIDNIVPIVGALESLAGQLACARITYEELVDIEALYERLEQHFLRGEQRAYMQTAEAICNAVFLIAGNDSLSRVHEMLLRLLGWSRVADRAPPDWGAAAKEQLLMFRALQVRSGDFWTLVASRHCRHRAALLRQPRGRRATAAAPATHPAMPERPRATRPARATKHAGVIGWLEGWLGQDQKFQRR